MGVQPNGYLIQYSATENKILNIANCFNLLFLGYLNLELGYLNLEATVGAHPLDCSPIKLN